MPEVCTVVTAYKNETGRLAISVTEEEYHDKSIPTRACQITLPCDGLAK